MRLSPRQQHEIKRLTQDIFGRDSTVRLFGSRVDDEQRGGDVDLLVASPDGVEDPAMLSARLSTKISRLMHGRRVDVLLLAPNLKRLPIHEVAESEGILL